MSQYNKKVSVTQIEIQLCVTETATYPLRTGSSFDYVKNENPFKSYDLKGFRGNCILFSREEGIRTLDTL